MSKVNSSRTVMAERRQKRSRRNKRIRLIFMCVLISAMSLVFYAGFNFNKPVETAQVKETKQIINSNTNLANDGKPMTIMLMGVDERNEDVGRSDTLMVVSLDSNHDKVSLLSIPRDTRVKIKRHGYDKINAAYAYGGEKLSQSTVESFLGFDIDHHIIVNTNSFVKLIDAIGGIDIDVEKRMYYEDPWDDNGGLVIDLKPGLQHMNGETAITYVRYRDEEGDAGRVRRQQKFMRACVDKLSSPSTVIKLPEIFSEIRNSVSTDLSFSEMLEVAGTLKNADQSNDGIKTGIVPGRWLYIDGVSYLVPNIERLGEIITDNLKINKDNLEEHFEKIEYEYSDSVPYDINFNIDSYDENVNETKDRDLIKYLNEKDFEIKENEV